jgi:hypothetical protein
MQINMIQTRNGKNGRFGIRPVVQHIQRAYKKTDLTIKQGFRLHLIETRFIISLNYSKMTYCLKKKYTHVVFICTLVLCANCSQKVVSDDDVDPFIETITSSLSEVNIVSTTALLTDESDIFIPMHPRRDYNGNYILVEGQRWYISLLDKKGAILDRVGGAGQGPGEFQGISQIEIAPNNQLYVLDTPQRRITHYNVTEDKLEFVRVISIEFQTNISHSTNQLRNIHVSDAGIYGIIATPRPERKFELYKLNTSFQPVEKILELEEHFPNIYLSNNRLTNTSWFFSESTFNYVYLDSMVIYSVDLNTYVTERYTLHEPHIQRNANSLNHHYIAERFASGTTGNVSNSGSNTNLELAQIFRATRHENIFVVDIIYYGGTHSYLLLFDKTKNDIKYLKAPPGFFIESFVGDEIIGLRVRADATNDVLILNLE